MDAWNEIQYRNRTVFGATWSNDGTHLACGDNFGTISIWDMSGAPQKTVWHNAHKRTCAGSPTSASIYCLETLPEALGGHLVSGGMDGDIVLWKWPGENPEEVARFKKHPKAGETNGISILTGRTNAVVCACGTYGRPEPGVAVIYDIESGKNIGTFQGHTKSLLCVTASQSTSQAGECVITGSEDGSVKLWDLRTLECTRTFTPQGAKWISCVEVDAAGTQVVCGGGACEISCCLLPSLIPMAAAPLPAPLQTARYADDGTLFCGYGNTVARYSAELGPVSTRSVAGIQTVYDIALSKQRLDSTDPAALLLAQLSSNFLASKVAIVGEGSCVEVIENDACEATRLDF